MDYFSASILVIYNLYYALIRFLELNMANTSNGDNYVNLRNQHRTIIGVIFTSFISYHIYYLNYVKFDYGYNMRVNIAAGNR